MVLMRRRGGKSLVVGVGLKKIVLDCVKMCSGGVVVSVFLGVWVCVFIA
jgi:hypothetical protein